MLLLVSCHVSPPSSSHKQWPAPRLGWNIYLSKGFVIFYSSFELNSDFVQLNDQRLPSDRSRSCLCHTAHNICVTLQLLRCFYTSYTVLFLRTKQPNVPPLWVLAIPFIRLFFQTIWVHCFRALGQLCGWNPEGLRPCAQPANVRSTTPPAGGGPRPKPKGPRPTSSPPSPVRPPGRTGRG